MKKKTFEEVEAVFNQRGFTLVSKEYKSNKLPLNYICSNGHQTKLSFSNLQKGRGCAECGGSKKKTFEEVELAFKLRGYTLVSKEYKNSGTVLLYICSQGHQAKISFDNLQNGQNCAECSGNKKKTIAEVRELFESRGFQLLSDEYKNNSSPLVCLCSNGHNATISFSSFQKGHGCAECGGSKKKTFEEVKSEFNKRGYTLLSIEYKNTHSLLNYVCGRCHQTKISFNNLQKGAGCSSCAEYGFNPNKSAILYYLRFQYEGNFYYKIGITNNTISSRFQSESTSFTVIKETVYPVGQDAYTQEQAILKNFSAYRYKGKPFLDCGNTELFIKDVLQLDYSILMTAC